MIIRNLSNVLQDHLINSYYSPDGIEYNIGRIPMASCDFSTRIYTYDDVSGDFNLTHFNLVSEDLNFKIPVIKTALTRSKREIKLFGSPWSAPALMKNSNNTVGGQLIGVAGDKYHKTWAEYFVKFLDAYKKNGIKLWGVTVENEPSAGYVPGYKFQCMGFTGSTERDFVKSDLGPALVQAGHSDVKLMIFDDNRLTLPAFTDKVLSDKDTAKYVSGVGVHWYEDFFLPASFLSDLHD
ncbi:glucosylceramidase-like, partial [Paramuricea clavata]